MSTDLLTTLHRHAQPLLQGHDDYDALLDKIADAEVVLLGEATHGTDEFYAARVAITKRLIKEKGFTSIAIEGDWPDVYQLHRYIQGHQSAGVVEDALKAFTRFPSWMWANTVMRDFSVWLRGYNAELQAGSQKINLYGLDLYSLHSSIAAVINYLEKLDRKAAALARERYSCLGSGQINSLNLQLEKSCQAKIIAQLLELQRQSYHYLKSDGAQAQAEYFSAVQNARLIQNAEAYYRAQFEGEVSSWNLRDQHMFETLLAIKAHHEQSQQKPNKIVVWAHNSHVGDARATEMSHSGELNIGQLARMHFADGAFNVGFSTYEGRVMAADYWGGAAEFKIINPGLAGSYEELFHRLQLPDFLLLLKNNHELKSALPDTALQRAIGVIYRPESERQSHYFYAKLAQQFDALLHFDRTRALQPLVPVPEEITDEMPDTYPSGI